MKSLRQSLAIAGLVAFCLGFPMRALPQTVPASGRTIVYPLENPPSIDTVLQPARFQRLGFGTWMMQALGLTTQGTGYYGGCTTSAGTGLFVTIAPTTASTLCALYQVTVDDASAIPMGYTPSLPPDSTLVVVAGLESGTTSPIGPLTAPVSNSVYWLVEAQLVTTDTDPQSRGFYSPVSGTMQAETVNTQRQDAIAYQTKEGTPGVSPSKPSADSGWIAVAYVLIDASQTQVTSDDISNGSIFKGFQLTP